jgi:hypothetical protein
MDLSDADKQRVIAFIADNIEKHYREHQVYEVDPVMTGFETGLTLEDRREKYEADIEKVWYVCTDCYHAGEMNEDKAVKHAMEELGLLDDDGVAE